MNEKDPTEYFQKLLQYNAADLETKFPGTAVCVLIEFNGYASSISNVGSVESMQMIENAVKTLASLFSAAPEKEVN